jgi:hypothetical protein
MIENTNSKLDLLKDEVRNCLISKSSDLKEIKIALDNLIYFLTTNEGRTDENCLYVDGYFLLHEEHGFSWDHLPIEYQLILDDIGGLLHDTFVAPEIAMNFESTPEQLLCRIKKLP